MHALWHVCPCSHPHVQVITDLLDPANTNLKIHEGPQEQIVVGSLSEKIVVSPEEMLTYMHEGAS